MRGAWIDEEKEENLQGRPFGGFGQVEGEEGTFAIFYSFGWLVEEAILDIFKGLPLLLTSVTFSSLRSL